MARSAPKQIKYTPADLVNMTPKEMRSVYARLRKTYKRRQDRLREAGYGEDVAAKRGLYSSKHFTDSQIRGEVLKLSKQLRDPRSTVAGRRAQEEKISASLEASGYQIPKGKQAEFGRFMEWSREKYKNRKLPPSDMVAQAYEQAQRLNIPVSVLENQFKAYLTNEAKVDELQNLLGLMNETEIPKNKSRVSAAYLKRQLKAGYQAGEDDSEW